MRNSLVPYLGLSETDYNYVILRLLNGLTGIVLASHGLAISLSRGGVVQTLDLYAGTYGPAFRLIISSLLFFFGGLSIFCPVYARWQGIIAVFAFLPWVVLGVIWGIDADSYTTPLTLISLFLYMLLSQLISPESAR